MKAAAKKKAAVKKAQAIANGVAVTLAELAEKDRGRYLTTSDGPLWGEEWA